MTSQGSKGEWDVLGSSVGAPLGVLIHLAWWYMNTHTWEITKKIQHCVPQRVEFAAAHGRQALWVVLQEDGFSWFSQNKDALQCPQRNYLEKLMQTFDRKEGRKKKNQENRFICLYNTIWSLVDKYKPTFCFSSLSSPTKAVLAANWMQRRAETTGFIQRRVLAALEEPIFPLLGVWIDFSESAGGVKYAHILHIHGST